MAGTQPAGTGTQETPYLITSLANLEWMATEATAFQLSKYYRQANNIDFFTGTLSRPIGDASDRAFTGVYDGNNKKIDNFNVTGYSFYCGMFGRTSDCIIKDLEINISSTYIPDKIYSGVLVGYDYDSNFWDILITGTGSISFNTTSLEFGAIAGRSSGGIFINCKNELNISFSTCDLVGGILGQFTSSGQIENCINSGNLEVSSGNYPDSAIGGIVAKIGHLEDTHRISECENSGNVLGYKNVGGIVGYVEDNASSLIVEKCVNRGTIDKSYYYTASGGIIGYADSNNIVTIKDCYHAGNITSDNNSGGIIGAWGINNIMTILKCYVTGGIPASGSNTNAIAGSKTTSGCTLRFEDNFHLSTLNEDLYISTSKTNTQLKSVDTFTDETTTGLTNAWDFLGNPNDDTGTYDNWFIDSEINSGYPELLWLYPNYNQTEQKPPILIFD